LVDLLRSWNIEPVATVGHSSGTALQNDLTTNSAHTNGVFSGEIAAAYAAGYHTAAEAIVLAYFRGQVVAKNKREGCMLAVGLGIDKVQDYLFGVETKVKIAAVNSPNSVTLSGETAAVVSIFDRCKAENIFARVLRTGGNAYHSHHMIALGEEYEILVRQGIDETTDEIAQDALFPTSSTWISSVNPHKTLSRKSLSPSYWRRNLESPVLFSQAIETLIQRENLTVDLLVEVGPHPALAGLLNQIRIEIERNGAKMPICHGTLRKSQDALMNILTLAGDLFINNTAINLAAVNAMDQVENGKWELAHGKVCVDLPNYVYHYGPPIYYENRFNRELRLRKHLRHDLLGARQPGNSKSHPTWRNMLRLKDVLWLADHKVRLYRVLP